MIKTYGDLAVNLVHIYKMDIYSMKDETITQYKVIDNNYKEFIFDRNRIHDLIVQSLFYHGFVSKPSLLSAIKVRYIIDSILIKNLTAHEEYQKQWEKI